MQHIAGPPHSTMETAAQIWHAHSTAISLTAAWLFSAAMSTMPPLSDKAGFWATWIYKFMQAVAANFSKHDNPAGIAGQSQAPDRINLPNLPNSGTVQTLK